MYVLTIHSCFHFIGYLAAAALMGGLSSCSDFQEILSNQSLHSLRGCHLRRRNPTHSLWINEFKKREGNHMESSGFTFFSFYLHDNPSRHTWTTPHGEPQPTTKKRKFQFQNKKKFKKIKYSNFFWDSLTSLMFAIYECDICGSIWGNWINLHISTPGIYLLRLLPKKLKP